MIELTRMMWYRLQRPLSPYRNFENGDKKLVKVPRLFLSAFFATYFGFP